MKLQTTLIAVALAFAGSAASAATVGTLYDAVTGTAIANGAELGPNLYTAVQADIQPTYTPSFDYVYNFALAAPSNLDINANTYMGPVVDGGATFALYSGTSTGASGTPETMIQSSFAFGSTITSSTLMNVQSGAYFFEVMGMPSTMIGTAFNLTLQAPSETTPLPAVPEPANVALMLAGLGLFGFMAKRRARQ